MFFFDKADIEMEASEIKREKAAFTGDLGIAENWIQDERKRWPNNEIPWKYGSFFSK